MQGNGNELMEKLNEGEQNEFGYDMQAERRRGISKGRKMKFRFFWEEEEQEEQLNKKKKKKGMQLTGREIGSTITCNTLD